MIKQLFDSMDQLLGEVLMTGQTSSPPQQSTPGKPDDKLQSALGGLKGAMNSLAASLDSNSKANLHRNFGLMAFERGDHKQAAMLLVKAADVYTEAGDVVAVATCMEDIALVFDSQGHRKEAIGSWTEAQALYTSAGMTAEAERVRRKIREVGN